MELTLAIIKPDAVKRDLIGKIITMMEGANLKVAGMRMVHLTQDDAEEFYMEHKGNAYFLPLCAYMTSGPCVVLALEGENAIKRYRDLMGKTDPKLYLPGTIRAQFALTMRENSVHGSDSPASAARELAFFFNDTELVNQSENFYDERYVSNH